MEDFIIILIGFAVMLYSAYSKNKKAKDKLAQQDDEEQAYDNTSSNSSDEGRDFIEQFFGENEEKSSHPFASESHAMDTDIYKDTSNIKTQTGNMEQGNVQKSPISNPYKAYQSQEKKERRIIPEEGVKSTKKTNYAASLEQRKRQQKKKWFNLRNAVVYSEILNRKY